MCVYTLPTNPPQLQVDSDSCKIKRRYAFLLYYMYAEFRGVQH
jgi:hypothetical protein